MKTSCRVWFYTIFVIVSVQKIYAQFTDWTFQYKSNLNAEIGNPNSDVNENDKTQNNENQELYGSNGNKEVDTEYESNPLNGDDETNQLNGNDENSEPMEYDEKNAPNENDKNNEYDENSAPNGDIEKNSYPDGDDENNQLNEDDEYYDNDELNKPQQYNYNIQDVISGFNITPSEIEKFHIWPAGVVPYYIDPLSYDKVLRDKIRSYLNAINVQTGLRFTELPSVPDNDTQRFVMFVNRLNQRDCQTFTIHDFTNVGMQPVRIGYDCLSNAGNIAAAVLALAGVPPMHTAPNRDCHVNVNTENIQPDKAALFNKLSDTDWLFHDLPYDHCSAGHFSLSQYSVNGKDSMTPVPEKNSNTCTVGEVKQLSAIDSIKIKLLYNFLKRNYQKNKVQSDCLKLFKKGPNFNAMQLTEEEPLDDPKPARYLGKVNTPMNCDEPDPNIPVDNGADSNEVDPNVAQDEDNSSKGGDQVDGDVDQLDGGDYVSNEDENNGNVKTDEVSGEANKNSIPQNVNEDDDNESADPDHYGDYK